MRKDIYIGWFTVLLAVLILPARAQDSLSNKLLKNARQQFSLRQYDSATYYATLALDSSFEASERAIAYYELGRALRRQDEYTKAQNNLVNAIRLTQDSSLKVRTHYELGKSYSDRVQPEVAIYHYQRALLFNPDTLDLVYIYEGIADEYNYYYFDYTDAENFYEKALNYLQSLSEANEALLLRLLYNLATTHQRRNDYFAALDYAQRAARLAEETKSINLDLCYSLLGTIYHQLKEYDLAISAYQSAIKQGEITEGENSPYLARRYNNLGLLYNDLEQYEEAISYYRMARSVAVLNHYPHAQADLADSYQYLGIAYTQLHDFPGARPYLAQALRLKRSFYGAKHPEVASVLDAFAAHYHEQNQLDSALHFQQRALKAEIPSFSSENITRNPSWEQLQDYTRSFHFLNEKAKLLHERFSKAGSTDDLQLAINTFLLADSLMHVHRISYEYESSQLQLLENQKSVYETAISSCYLMYDATRDQQYLKHALYFMERSKAAILWDVLRDVAAKSNLGVSDSLQQVERSLRTQLARVVNDITQLERDTLADSTALLSLQQKRFQLLRRQHDLQEELQQAYPNYVRLKYASPALPWDQLQQTLLDEGQHIVEFFWGDSTLYSMSLSSDSIRFQRMTVTEALLGSIEQMQQLLKQGPSSEHYLEDTKQYLTSAFAIYNQIVGPLLEESLPQYLTIIPDGPLAYLPFEALLTQAVTPSKEPDYGEFPYLLHQTAIQYSPSLQVLLNTDETSLTNSTHLRTLAFGFTNRKQPQSNSNRHRLAALPGTFQELSAISKLTSARLFSGAEASETRFKEDAESYQIIHLALHGQADMTNPTNNVLFFPAEPDSINDGELYSFELYDLRLANTKLAVLSACETGTGSWRAGEGVYSMGRGFAYAGCPSVIMSLWKVNDMFTSRIMPMLYRSLYKGIRIDRSLQKAKLSYIQQANEYQAHPSYWAAFVLQGESLPIVRYQHTYWAGTFVLLVSVGYLVFALTYKKKAGAMHPANS